MADPAPIPSLDDDEAERRALAEAVAEARADSTPGIPHEKARLDMLREIDRLRRRVSPSS